MTSDRLKRMQESFAAKAPAGEGTERGPSRYYPLGKVEIDSSATFRFLRDKNPDNDSGFIKEIINHNLMINGQEKRVPCLEMWGESCPVCEQAKLFFNADNNAMGSKFWKKRNYLTQVLVIEDPLKLEIDPANPIKLLSFGAQVYAVIRESIVSGDIETDPDAYQQGHNFIIKKTKGGAKADGSGFYPTYAIGTRFSPKQTDVPQDLRDLIEEHLINLDDMVPNKPDVASVHADLQAALGGAARQSTPARSTPSVPQNTPAANDQDDAADSTPAATPAKTVQSSTADLLARLKDRPAK